MAESTKTLKAVLSATETVSQALEDIETGLRELSEKGEITSESMDDVTRSVEKANSAFERGSRKVDEETRSLTKASGAAKNLSEQKDSVTISNEKLGVAARKTGNLLDREGRAMAKAAVNAKSFEEFLGQLSKQNVRTSVSVRELKEKLGDLSFQNIETTGTATTLIASLMGTKTAADQTEDEINHLSRAMERLGISSLSTSLNLGPFNFRLKNIFILLPGLISVVGALTASLGALAVAAMAAAVALGMIFAGGFLVMAQGIADSTEDIEKRMEAVQKIMEELGRVFSKALEPLQNGLSQDMLTRFINGLASALNMVAQSVANIQERMSEFQKNAGIAFFQTFEQLILATEDILVSLLPEITKFMAWVNTRLADAFRFMNKEVQRFLPALKEFSGTLMDFIVAFSEAGATALKGIFPVLGGLLTLIKGIADAFNTLPDVIGSNILKFIALIIVGRKLIDTGKLLAKAFKDLFKGIPQSTQEVVEKLRDMNDKFDAVTENQSALEAFFDHLKGKLTSTSAVANETQKQFWELGEQMLRTAKIARGSFGDGPTIMTDGGQVIEENLPAAPTKTKQPATVNNVKTPSELPGGDSTTTSPTVDDSIWVPSEVVDDGVGGELGDTGATAIEAGAQASFLAQVLQKLTGKSLALRAVLSKLATTIAGLFTGGTLFVAAAAAAGALLVISANIQETWNMLIDLAELILSPFLGLWEMMKRILAPFEGLWNMTIRIGEAIWDWLGGFGVVFQVIGDIFDVISDVVYGVLVAAGDFIGGIIELTIGLLKFIGIVVAAIGDMAMSLGFVKDTISVINGLISGMQDIWDGMMFAFNGMWLGTMAIIQDSIRWMIDLVNSFIDYVNRIPGVDIEHAQGFSIRGGDTPASSSLEEHKKEKEKNVEKETAPGKSVENNYITKNEYNFGDFNMLPEEKARVKGLVKDALNKAQRNKRMQGGHIG